MDLIKFNVNLSGELHRRFKLVSVQQAKDMSEIIRKLIEEYVRKAEKKLKK
jgi:metal-responsive CopG/Arc/MetJ family transcriptional regulator